MAERSLPSRVVPKPPSHLTWEEWEAEWRSLSRELGVQVPDGMFEQLRRNASNASAAIAPSGNVGGYTPTLCGIQEDQHEESDEGREDDDHSDSASEDGSGGDSFDYPQDADTYDDAYDNYDDVYDDYEDGDDDHDY